MNNSPYRCPIYGNPTSCNCASCAIERRLRASREAVKAAEIANLSRPPAPQPKNLDDYFISPKESPREKIERQRRERFAESDRTWAYVQANKGRNAAHREQILDERKFYLGWMQNSETQYQSTLFRELFTSQTPIEHQQFIKQCNAHLNEPVRAGEIVIIPTVPPTSNVEQQALIDLQEEAKAASTELGKLDDDQISSVNRHLELLDYYANQTLNQVAQDGLPTDYYTYASLGIGMASAGVEQHLKNINSVLLQINDLYVQHVAMASRVGGINYGSFVAERAALFEKLDGSFAALSKRSIQLPIYTQIKRNLKLSTKSVVHHADEILKTGFVKNLGKRIANVAMGISASRGVGYVGLVLGASSGVKNIYEACNVDSTGECGKTTAREVAGFIGGIGGGALGAEIALAGVLLILGTASAPVVAVAAIGAFVTGGAIGGVVGSKGSKVAADFIYESITEKLGDY